jgi:hypothetical protein
MLNEVEKQYNTGSRKVGITDGSDLWSTLLRWPQDGMIHISSFMEIGTGVQAIVWFYFRNFKGCNADISDRKDLWSASLKWT